MDNLLYIIAFIVGGVIVALLFSQGHSDTIRFIKLGAIGGVAVALLYVVDEAKTTYNKAVKWFEEYNKKLAEDEERVNRELSEKVEKERLLEQCQTSIVKTEETLKEVYNMNVIFPKYRGMVAISQIYEYFASGRCTESGGPTGAYNLYEQELRMNVIISKMDDIIDELEDIKENQCMLYGAIQQTNYLLSNIKDNTVISAYNSEVIAVNTSIRNQYGFY